MTETFSCDQAGESSVRQRRATSRHRSRSPPELRMGPTMVIKLAESAQKNRRRLTRSKLLADVIRGVNFKNGVRVEDSDQPSTNSRSARQPLPDPMPLPNI